jgi:uncharacterized protein (TIGR02996 family)
MSPHLWSHPRALSLLAAAKQSPEDDTPRVVLADWLEDNGDHDRAEFVRVQCRLSSSREQFPAGERQALAERCDRLVATNGGAWLGPLWRYQTVAMGWHRGLLAAALPREFTSEDLAGVGPWIDTARLEVTGKDSLARASALVADQELNHLSLHLRKPMREQTLLDGLTRLPASPCLRTLTFRWPVRMLRQGRLGAEPDVTEAFLARLLVNTPACRHLTHLASSVRFGEAQALLVEGLGVRPAHADASLWMHRLDPAAFRARNRRRPGRPPSAGE